MGLFGGSSKSKTASNVVSGSVGNYGDGPTNTAAGISGNNAVAFGNGNALTVSGLTRSNVTINASDYGAIDAGNSLARAALESNGAAFQTAIAKVSENANAIVNKTLGIAAKTQVSESAQFQDLLLKLALIVGAGMAALAYLKKG